MSEATNPKCPIHASHHENATERMFPNFYCKGFDRSAITAEQWAEIDADAEIEYMDCEGHD